MVFLTSNICWKKFTFNVHRPTYDTPLKMLVKLKIGTTIRNTCSYWMAFILRGIVLHIPRTITQHHISHENQLQFHAFEVIFFHTVRPFNSGIKILILVEFFQDSMQHFDFSLVRKRYKFKHSLHLNFFQFMFKFFLDLIYILKVVIASRFHAICKLKLLKKSSVEDNKMYNQSIC